MEHIFSKHKVESGLSWEALSAQRIKEGRGDLGETMPVMVHRLMERALYECLVQDKGRDQADHYFRMAGKLAGEAFAANALDLNVDMNTFLANLQTIFLDLKIGILRLELLNDTTGEIILTVGEDLTCSGIPITGNTVCHYEEGFISGVFHVYTKHPCTFREIDCWATGARICRFQGFIVKPQHE